MKRNILLLEPNYKNKYPPIGLMKISTYHRKQGDNVVFFKGNLKDFIVNQITIDCIKKLIEIDESIDWNNYNIYISEYIKTRKKEFLQKIETEKSQFKLLIDPWLEYFKDYYHKKEYIKNPQWDRVFVTTLFTFYWDITIETIEFAKTQVRDMSNLMVGGVMATILADEVEIATGVKPYKGTLSQPGILDNGNTDIIDELPLDYSILDEIDYKYPESNAYYGYTTRGCIRHCAFCAVPTLEPTYEEYLPLKQRIDGIRSKYGDQRNLLLMDNNVLASNMFSDIINDIKESGFTKGSKFIEPNHFEIAIRNLKSGENDNAYIRRTFNLIKDLESKIKDEKTKQFIYKIRKENSLFKIETCTKSNLLKIYADLAPFFEKYRNKAISSRHVDFNQGVDARLFTKENVELLSQIPIRPLRIAFDNVKELPYYEKAIRMSNQVGIKEFSNYLLYNFKDKPIDLYQRLKINVELCEELDVNIYSFPMKFHPIRGEYSHNRNFIGDNWNRKHIRAIQAILNSTKGKIGKGKDFFYKAFGSTEEEFFELLEMPETFILYRFFFEWLGEKKNYIASTTNWRKDFEDLSDEDRHEALLIIHKNDFNNVELKTSNKEILNVLKYYTNYRNDIITPTTELYHLKQEFDNSKYGYQKKKNQLK